MIALPLAFGAVQASVTRPLAAVAERPVGTAGAVASGAVAAETADGRPMPNWFTADTRKR